MTIAPPASNPPDWSAITDTICCPLCEYDLRGLSVPRCPECGYQFDWPELLDADRRAKLFVFEHAINHYRRAFLRTSIAGWAPWSFWRRLQPQQPIDLGRLRFYSLISVLLYFVSAGAIVLATPMVAAYAEKRDLIMALLDYDMAMSNIGSSIPVTIALCGFVYLIWPWLSFVTLRIFTDSMRRANVNTAHVLRCTLYSCDAGFVFGILISLPAYAQVLNPRWIAFKTGLLFETTELYLFVAALLFSILTAIRLAFAYRLYLRFPHAAATAIASQIIVFLAISFVVATIF
ncbi:MAG: hypothetical protein H7Z14_11690 [Anaerolineae bacterium]|nr:hypothetical protein [Phycisphaerae bacterium]